MRGPDRSSGGGHALDNTVSTSTPSICRERGSGSVYVLGLMAVVVLVGITGLALGAALVARHRAAAAADLSAISAAADVIEGGGSACRKAASVAAAQGARLTSCQIAGAIATVTVQVRMAGPLSHVGSATGHARAGPVH
jgi:secretion/DNA translocation related TadE-like protein